MKTIFYALILTLAANAAADTFVLNDGARLEGEVTGEMDGALLVKTKYGSLTINKADIKEQQAPPAAEIIAPAAPAEPVTIIPEPIAVSTMPPPAGLSTVLTEAVEVSTAALEAEPAPSQREPLVGEAPKLTFQTVLPGTTTRLLVYLESGVAIATETFDAGGALTASEGAIGNGTYTEYFPDGSLKTVKTMMSGKANGTLKAFYPSGALQMEAYFLAGGKEGPLKYYTEDGKLLLEASYGNDLLNGWKREYGADGAVTSETFYADNRPAEPPAANAPGTAKELEPPSQVTAKLMLLARGERISFSLNGKYIGKIQLDRDFNILGQDGKIPDGAVRVYSAGGKFSRSYGAKASGTDAFEWDGKIARELFFEKNSLKRLRTFDIDGNTEKEYLFKDGKILNR